MLAEDLRPPKRARNPLPNWVEQKEREGERKSYALGRASVVIDVHKIWIGTMFQQNTCTFLFLALDALSVLCQKTDGKFKEFKGNTPKVSPIP